MVTELGAQLGIVGLPPPLRWTFPQGLSVAKKKTVANRGPAATKTKTCSPLVRLYFWVCPHNCFLKIREMLDKQEILDIIY